MAKAEILRVYNTNNENSFLNNQQLASKVIKFQKMYTK